MIYFLPFFLSLILYLIAPKDYSYAFNIILLALYVLDFFILIKKEKIRSLSYPSLFFLVYFFVNFAYPVFIYPLDPTYILQFRYSFSSDYINVGSALSLVAFSVFILGYSQRKRYNKIVFEEQCSILNTKYYLIFTILSVLVLLYNLILIVPQIGINYADAKVPFQTGSLFVMLESTLSFLLCYINKVKIKGNTKCFFLILGLHILLSSVFAFGCLLLGSREYVLTLVLLFAILYSLYVKPINAVKLICGIFIGIVVFYSISQIRNDDHITNSKELFEIKPWQNGQVSGVWNLATDLIINNRNLYVGMQYADDPRHGYSYGYNYIPYLLSPIPFLPSIFTKYVLGTTVVDLTSQQILTNYTRDDLGESSLDYELGSNCTVDVYMAFGVIGVIIIFYCLGLFIRYLESTMDYNAKAACVYIVLFTGVVFFCRSSFLGPLHNVVWSYWVCCLCLKKIGPQRNG